MRVYVGLRTIVHGVPGLICGVPIVSAFSWTARSDSELRVWVRRSAAPPFYYVCLTLGIANGKAKQRIVLSAAWSPG